MSVELNPYGSATIGGAIAVTTPPASTAATSSTPYGYTQAQANAIKDWIIAVDAALKDRGIIASS